MSGILMLNPLRWGCEGWQRRRRKLLSIIPLQTAVPVGGFSSPPLFVCLADSVDCVFVISHIVSCHWVVSCVDNQPHHQAGGETVPFLCLTVGFYPSFYYLTSQRCLSKPISNSYSTPWTDLQSITEQFYFHLAKTSMVLNCEYPIFVIQSNG